jgi:hypothetical protein
MECNIEGRKINMQKSNWSGRAFASLCTLVSFVLLGLTGIILFVEPQGRVAYWTRWSFLSLEKDQWGNIHILSGLLFLVTGGFHIYYNWNPLMKYLSSRVETSLRHKRELAISSLILLWILASGIWGLPPLAYVSDLGETVKNAWITAPELEPPFGHAELVSLRTFCKKQRIPLDQAMEALRKAGFRIDNPKNTLAEIADSKGTSGMEVYKVIKKLEDRSEIMAPDKAWTPERIEETFAGTGVGRKSVSWITEEMGIDPDTAYQRLKQTGIEAGADDKINELAERHGTTPIEVLTVILMGKK